MRDLLNNCCSSTENSTEPKVKGSSASVACPADRAPPGGRSGSTSSLSSAATAGGMPVTSVSEAGGQLDPAVSASCSVAASVSGPTGSAAAAATDQR